MLDEATKEQLTALKTTAPTAAEAAARKQGSPANGAGGTPVATRARVMPSKRPADMPDFAAWAAQAGGRLLTYDTKPWTSPSGRGAPGTEHLWIALASRTGLPWLRQRLRAQGARVIHEAHALTANGGFDGAVREVVTVFKDKLGESLTGADAKLGDAAVFVVFGWLEV